MFIFVAVIIQVGSVVLLDPFTKLGRSRRLRRMYGTVER